MSLRLAVPIVISLCVGGYARAEPTAGAQCGLIEILASNSKKGVDPRLESLKGKLSKPPFASFDTFSVLTSQTLVADLHKPVTAHLSRGTTSLLFKDRVVVQAGKPRLHMGVDFDDQAGHRVVSTTVTLDSGEPFFPVAGVPVPGGTYILALTCAAP